MHRKGDIYKRNGPPVEGLDFIIDHWRRFYFFDLNRKYENVLQPVQVACKIVASGCTHFTSTPVANCFPNKRAVMMMKNILMMENEKGELVTTILANDEEIIQAYNKYFPFINEEKVKRALEEWHRVSVDTN